MWNCHSWPLDATTRGVDLTVDLQIWPLTVEMWNCHSWPLDATTWGVDLPLDLPLWANISSHSRNVISPFLTTRCQYWGVDLPVDLPVDLQIWPLTVEMWNCHSWPLDATTGGLDLPVDLPVDLQIWPLTVEMSYHHTWALDASYRGQICHVICQYEL